MIKIRNRRRFEVSLDKFAKQVNLDVVTVVKKLALDIFADIVSGTPVDTGRAMNNWNISIGSIDRSTTEKGGNPRSISTAKQGNAFRKLSSLQPFQKVWISNHLPYIGFLEDGSSDKAPNGWVEASIRNNLASVQLDG